MHHSMTLAHHMQLTTTSIILTVTIATQYVIHTDAIANINIKDFNATPTELHITAIHYTSLGIEYWNYIIPI